MGQSHQMFDRNFGVCIIKSVHSVAPLWLFSIHYFIDLGIWNNFVIAVYIMKAAGDITQEFLKTPTYSSCTINGFPKAASVVGLSPTYSF